MNKKIRIKIVLDLVAALMILSSAIVRSQINLITEFDMNEFLTNSNKIGDTLQSINDFESGQYRYFAFKFLLNYFE